MIPEILSAFLMVFLSFGGFADARRDTHLRVQQHITMHDGIYSKCEHWFGSGKTCEECIKSKGYLYCRVRVYNHFVCESS